MNGSRVHSPNNLKCALISSRMALILATGIGTASAQPPPAAPPVQAPSVQQPHQHEAPPQDPHAQHMQHMAEGATALFEARDASGTAWLPDETPMYGLHRQAGAWELMAHGNLFLQYLSEGSDRGDDQFGSINWIMGMARRELSGGRLGVRAMLSLEPFTIRGCGYPDLLATGEVCDGEAIHDRQHPHDLFMELAAEYDAPIQGSLRWHVYGGLAGEPALGPVAYPHRVSAMPNPLAPISHHWLDATHITFGVVTGGVYGKPWKAEASVFNGREPDEHRKDFDFGALDSVSGRVWFMPNRSLALQVSAGHLNDAEADHGGRIDVDRVTASATYHRGLDDGLWASTIAWGMNTEGGESTHALLFETNLTVADRDTWFGRVEIGGKDAHDLDIHGVDEVFTVSKLQGGYTRYFSPWKGLQPGFGGSVSVGFVPESLEGVYGGRANGGAAVYVTLRPAAHGM